MKITALTSIILGFLFGCSSQPAHDRLHSDMISSKKEKAEVSTSPDDGNEDEEEEITAVRPAIISGSYLACNAMIKNQGSQTVEISCHFEYEGKRLRGVELQESDFLIKDGNSKKAILSFSKNDDGSFTFKTKLDSIDDLAISLETINGNPLPAETNFDQLSVIIEEEVLAPQAKIEEAKPEETAPQESTHEEQQAQSDPPEELPADTSPPTDIAIIINAGDEYTNSEIVDLELRATDAAEMYITKDKDCSKYGEWEPFTSSKVWPLDKSNKTVKVHVKFRDATGNESLCISDSIIHDDQAPSSPSLAIGMSEFTRTMTNTLYLSAENAEKMYVTNVLGCVSGGIWEDYSSTKEWELAHENVITNVLTKFRDAAGNESACVGDIIKHDDIAPSEPLSVSNDSYTAVFSDSPIITWGESTDTETWIDYYEVSIGTSSGDDSVKTWTNVGDVSTISFNDLSLESGITFYANVRAIDKAGNVSSESTGNGFTYNHCKSLGSGDNWILVPGSETYNTDDFCVMKFEAKDNSGSPVSASAGTPWMNISAIDAVGKCESLGPEYHLISNPEWMTIASDITFVSSNWSDGSVGNGALNVGHSNLDPLSACPADANDLNAYVQTNCTGQATGVFAQKRTHLLSNGEVIWDLSGNAFEWTNYYIGADKPTPALDAYVEYSLVEETVTTPLSQLIPQIAIDNNWTSSQGIGQYLGGQTNAGGVLRRGGDYASDGVGIFAGNFRYELSLPRFDTGFRCAKTIP